MTDLEIYKTAEETITWKGYPFSQTEFSERYATALSYLQNNGATKEQIKTFKKLVDSAPIRGGRFNPYSGD